MTSSMLSPESFVRYKKLFISLQTVFYLAAIVFFVIEIVWIVRSFSYLGSSLDGAYAAADQAPSNLAFDIEGFLRLNLIRK